MALLPGWSLVESLFLQQFGEVVDVQTVAQTSIRYRVLDRCDVAVAVIVAGLRAVQHANSGNLPALAAVAANLNNHIAVIRRSSVSIVHKLSLVFDRQGRLAVVGAALAGGKEGSGLRPCFFAR